MLRLLAIFLLCFNVESFSQCNPVASLPFNGNTNDVSGNNNNGILGGTIPPVLTADRFGNPNSAYEFGGFYNPNWIQIPNSASLQLTNALSVSFWFKQCSFAGMDGNGNYSPNGYFILVSKAGDGIAAHPGYWCSSSVNTTNQLQVSFSNTNDSTQINVNYNDGSVFECFDTCEWIHCVVVAAGTSWQMYFNGQLSKQSTITQVDFSASNNEDLFIGRMYGGPAIWYPFNGIIDDLNIYNCALTQTDVDALYGNYTDPLAANNKIHLDSIVATTSCMTGGSLSVYPDNANLPCQFSIDGGALQNSNAFVNISPGTHQLKIVSSCTTLDTAVTIPNSYFIQNITAGICQGLTYQLPSGTFVNTPGVYSDTVQSTGCDTIFIIDLSVNPQYSTTITDSICPAGQYQLPDGTMVHQTGTFTSNLQTSSGCDSTIITILTARINLRDSIVPNAVFCYGYNDGRVRMFAPGAVQPVSFSVDSNSNASGIFSGFSPGTYSYSISDGSGCSVTGNFIITEPDEILIRLHPLDSTADAFETINVSARTNYPTTTYQWTPAINFLCDTCQQTTLFVDTDLMFTVTVTVKWNGATCVEDTTGFIHVNPVLFAPNAFTPNGDGLNETFKIVGRNFKNISSFHIRIFDRWGKMICNYDDPDISKFSWDGRYNGEPVQPGVYNYIYEYTAGFGTKETTKTKSGSIRLVK
jgi:gliding motility-associated-like protein